MPSRREQVRMSDAELADYLAGQSHVVLVTNGPDGWPHPVPMNFGTDPAGRLVLTSFRNSQKVRNLERDPRAALLIESGQTYAEFRGVIVYAEAEIVADTDEITRAMASIRAAAGVAGSMTQSMNVQVRASISKRVVLRFTPQRVVSWDHGKLGGYY